MTRGVATMRSAARGAFQLIAIASMVGALGLSHALAQEYPNKPIRVVVPFGPPGGIADRMARLVSDKLRERWGQPVIVENRPGANANVGAEFVARAPGDGYTLLFTNEGPMAINKHLFAKLNYEPEKFVPVSIVITQPLILVAGARLPFGNLGDLLAHARANPDKLNLGTNGNGSNMHLSLERLKLETGVKIGHVPYKGVTGAITDMVGGQIDLMFIGLGTVSALVKAGKLRILATASEARLPALPEVATMSETLPGFTAGGWFGVVSSPMTPPAIANRLSLAIRELIKHPEVQNFMNELNVQGVGSTPEEMAALARREGERWGKLIRATGIVAE